MEGAIALKVKSVKDVYVPLNRVFSLPHNTMLNRENRTKIYLSGFSRIPVYSASASASAPASRKLESFRFSMMKSFSNQDETASITGILLAKQLMLVESMDRRLLSSMPLQRPLCVSPKMDLNALLNVFQS